MSKNQVYNESFLQKLGIEAKIKREQRLKQQRQMQDRKNREMANYDYFQKLVNKEVLNDDIVKDGKIIRVKRGTLVENQFRVECEYKGQKTQVIASRDEIIDKNIGALLDYYQDLLKYNDKSQYFY